jgi:hypothetical protein
MAQINGLGVSVQVAGCGIVTKPLGTRESFFWNTRLECSERRAVNPASRQAARERFKWSPIRSVLHLK